MVWCTKVGTSLLSSSPHNQIHLSIPLCQNYPGKLKLAADRQVEERCVIVIPNLSTEGDNHPQERITIIGIPTHDRDDRDHSVIKGQSKKETKGDGKEAWTPGLLLLSKGMIVDPMREEVKGTIWIGIKSSEPLSTVLTPVENRGRGTGTTGECQEGENTVKGSKRVYTTPGMSSVQRTRNLH